MAGKPGGSKKSSLPAKTNARRNTKAGRAQMSASSFGLPAQRKYRIDDKPHATSALSRVEQHGTPAEKKQVRAAVAKRYPSINVTGLTRKKK